MASIASASSLSTTKRTPFFTNHGIHLAKAAACPTRSLSPRLSVLRASSEGKEEGDSQGGYVWLPTAPFVPRPRALYNAASLAYLGDCIYELYVRCHFLSPPQAIDKYNTLVMGLVCCEAQDVFLKMLLKDDFLTEEERDIVRWGKNVQTNHKRATKRAGAAVYSRASSLETLIGYLYLSNPSRLQEVMSKLGLTWSSASNVKNVELKNQLTVLAIAEERHESWEATAGL